MAIKTGWDFSDASAVNYVVEGLKGISNPLKADIDVSTGTIKASYNGEEFKSLSAITQGNADTIILDPKKHGGISNYDLEYFGTFFHVHDIGSNVNKNVFHISINGSDITPDYATWLIKDDHIEVECLIDPINVKAKFPYVGIRQQKILDYLKADPDVEITYDGIMDAGDFARNRTAFGQIDSPIPTKLNQFGKISILLDVGFPDTVADLIKYVKHFKNQLYIRVR